MLNFYPYYNWRFFLNLSCSPIFLFFIFHFTVLYFPLFLVAFFFHTFIRVFAAHSLPANSPFFVDIHSLVFPVFLFTFFSHSFISILSCAFPAPCNHFHPYLHFPLTPRHDHVPRSIIPSLYFQSFFFFQTLWRFFQLFPDLFFTLLLHWVTLVLFLLTFLVFLSFFLLIKKIL